jgi:hypothetical protein
LGSLAAKASKARTSTLTKTSNAVTRDPSTISPVWRSPAAAAGLGAHEANGIKHVCGSTERRQHRWVLRHCYRAASLLYTRPSLISQFPMPGSPQGR